MKYCRLLLLSLLSYPVTAQSLDERQAQLLAANCLQCHARPESTAPQLGAREDWQQVREQDAQTMLRHVVEGLGGMPPLGYCSACSESDLRSLSQFLIGAQVVEP